MTFEMPDQPHGQMYDDFVHLPSHSRDPCECLSCLDERRIYPCLLEDDRP